MNLYDSYDEDEEDEDDDDSIFSDDDEDDEDFVEAADDDLDDDLEGDDEDNEWEYEEEEDEEDEEDLEGAYDFGDEDLEDALDSCLMCGVMGIDGPDKWNFKLTGEDGTEDAWICRNCHGHFQQPEDFEKFLGNIAYRKLYRSTSTLQRLLVLRAPATIIANLAISTLASVFFWENEHNGSEEMRAAATMELRKIAEKFLENPE